MLIYQGVAILIQLLIFLCGNKAELQNIIFLVARTIFVQSLGDHRAIFSVDICTADLQGAMEEQHISLENLTQT